MLDDADTTLSSDEQSSVNPGPGLFDLRATHNPHRWLLPVEPKICVGPEGSTFLFGGAGLASSITAMERTTGRPTIWATAQYLSYARPGAIVDLDVHVPVAGKYTTQARVIGHVDDREIFTVNAAMGSRPGDISEQWVQAPAAAAPEQCLLREHWRSSSAGLHNEFEVRVVKGRQGLECAGGEMSDDGHVVLWVRPLNREIAIDSAVLAVIADFIPSAIGHAIGRNAGGNSLDNTIRYRHIEQTDWVLCDIQIQGMHGGFVHGQMQLFAQGGQLMATASQSLILRVRD
jgi:acyl-CoA thioesterase-2